MVFLAFEVFPLDSNRKSSDRGGAFVNCWINIRDQEKAEIQARKEIYKAGWHVISLNKVKTVNRKYFNDNKESLEYYEQAKIDGECYVFHTWPLDADDDEENGDTF